MKYEKIQSDIIKSCFSRRGYDVNTFDGWKIISESDNSKHYCINQNASALYVIDNNNYYIDNNKFCPPSLKLDTIKTFLDSASSTDYVLAPTCEYYKGDIKYIKLISDDKFAYINVKLLDYFDKKNVCYKIKNATSAIYAYEDEKLVGMIMPCRIADEKDLEKVEK